MASEPIQRMPAPHDKISTFCFHPPRDYDSGGSTADCRREMKEILELENLGILPIDHISMEGGRAKAERDGRYKKRKRDAQKKGIR